jgi:sugar phosphate isomerase/epimerase
LGDLDINSVHTLTTNFEHQLLNSSRRVRGDGFYWLDQVLNSAKLLGCNRYTFHGLYRLKTRYDNFDKMGEYFREICEFCARFGVSLCLENVEWSTYNRPGVFRELKSRCPDLLGTFDIKQARRSGYPYQMYIEEMAGSIAHVHLSDVDDGGRVRLPGEGRYDFEEIIKRLKGAGFDGAAIIEVYPDSFSDLSALSRSLNYLNEIIYKLSS